MESLHTRTIRDADEGDARLSELNLERDRLIAAAQHALAAASTASPLHPSNAAGMLSYLDGVKGLRLENGDDEWRVFRREGVEGICNDELKVRVLFANVFEACGTDDPQARSKKGAGSERVASGDMFEAAGVDLPVSVVKFHGEYRTYYLMVDPDGAVELSLPVVKNGRFLRCVERIFLLEGGVHDVDLDDDIPSEDADLDVVVTPK
ncbi:hypothetical protein F3S47_01955 [Histidinibacterium aquaticum]|uniref:Uncharacterized protein n=2 Tax=Histidinibacterium aquaticum TaxID=2613962 RepID=A0A5J5GT97_9RHOB|nr:hypothetical protein F3S47_01955 [Histidinibacterium aquaticum]